MNVVLIGYRGSGKTTVGRILADRNNASFVDTDELITHQAGIPIAQVFAKEGEASFRKREEAAISLAVRARGRVLSVGGGAILSESNRSLLRAYGSVVWLQASVEDLWERISNDGASTDLRPDLGQGGIDEIRTVLEKRTPIYAKLAHLAISTTGKTPTAIAEDIEAWLSL